MSNTYLIPNVSGTPGTVTTRDPAQATDPIALREQVSKTEGETKSFGQILGTQLERPVVEPLRFSAHASSRIQSRKLNLGVEDMRKLNEAVDRAAAKGLDDTLILTKDAAFIVSVKNRTVVTAMDRASLEGNVFTNIEGAVIL